MQQKQESIYTDTTFGGRFVACKHFGVGVEVEMVVVNVEFVIRSQHPAYILIQSTVYKNIHTNFVTLANDHPLETRRARRRAAATATSMGLVLFS